METIICDACEAGRVVYETGMSDSVREVLANLNATHCLPVDTRYETRIEALRAAVDAILANRSGKSISRTESSAVCIIEISWISVEQTVTILPVVSFRMQSAGAGCILLKPKQTADKSALAVAILIIVSV